MDPALDPVVSLTFNKGQLEFCHTYRSTDHWSQALVINANNKIKLYPTCFMHDELSWFTDKSKESLLSQAKYWSSGSFDFSVACLCSRIKNLDIMGLILCHILQKRNFYSNAFILCLRKRWVSLIQNKFSIKMFL